MTEFFGQFPIPAEPKQKPNYKEWAATLMENWYGLFAPAGVAPDAMATLERALLDGVRARLERDFRALGAGDQEARDRRRLGWWVR